MKNKQFNRYYLISCLGVLIASFYPLLMGVRVITDMITDGTVLKENYPKYIIPYTPISIAVIIGVLLMPLCIKLLKRFALVGGTFISAGVFFVLELLFEQKVVVETAETVVQLDDWQMLMCAYIPPKEDDYVTTVTNKTPVEILMGDYNPAFKLHFYIISLVIIFSLLNCMYGFAQAIKTGEKRELRRLSYSPLHLLHFSGCVFLHALQLSGETETFRCRPYRQLLWQYFSFCWA